jgi:Mrp family chromosome partitioning ATPase
VDVVKGIEMFDSLKVPTVAVIENMAYYKCKSCDDKHRIFGAGYTKQLVDQFGIQNSFEIPILEEVSAMSDAGTPFVLTLPSSMPIVELYDEIA